MFKTMMALAVAPHTIDEARRAMELYADQSDLIELRIDALREKDMAALLADKPCPVIVTNRPTWEGGRSEEDTPRRIEALLEADALGAEHIDCELASMEHLDKSALSHAKLIVSVHDFEGMPDFADLVRQCRAADADIAKVVGTANSIVDPLQPLEVLREAEKPAIALAMGAQGLLSRVLAFKFGAYLTFVSAPDGEGTAPGQPTLQAMHRIFRASLIDRETVVYGYLTKDTPPPKLIATANAALREAGRNAVLVPIIHQEEDPEEVMAAYRDFGLSGFAIRSSLPEPEQWTDKLDKSAQSCSCVTLLLREGPYWVGYGSDLEAVGHLLAHLGVPLETNVSAAPTHGAN